MNCVIMTPGTLVLMLTNDTECVNINTVTFYQKIICYISFSLV